MSAWKVDVSGPTTVTGPAGGAPLRTKERSIVAALALNHPTPATAASLAPLVWGDDLPNTAIKSVHNHVARIRSRAPDLIDTDEFGYRFHPGTEVLCNGGPSSYFDLADQPTVAVARARDRASAMRRAEEELRDRVRDGADDALLADVEDLVSTAPHRLLRWWWHALVAARLGRRQRALEILRACRGGPVHLDESDRAALDLFERAITDDDVFLDSPAAADPRSLGADQATSPDLRSTVAPVGIIDPTGVVAETMSAIDGGVGSVIVTAPAGGGKSSLLRAVNDRLPPLGWHCFATVCSPRDVDPLAPLLDLDAQRRARAGETEHRSRAGEAAGDFLITLLESLTQPSSRRTLFIIDDVHEASPDTARSLQRFAAEVVRSDGHVAVLFASRPDTAVTIDGGVKVELPPWNRGAVEAYVVAFVPSGAWTSGAARWIEARAGGNPLFVRELTITALRRLPNDPINMGFVEPNVASLVSGPAELRLDSLPERLRRTLVAAATLGEEFRRSDLAALADHVSPMLALAHAHGLVEPIDAERDRFVHQRFRQSFLDLLDDDERVELTERAATVVADSAGGTQRLDELARFARTAARHDPERAIVTTLQQAEQAAADLRLEATVSSAKLAMRLIEDTEGRSSRWATASVLAGTAAIGTGDPDATRLLLEGGARAIELGDHQTVGRAVARLGELSPLTGLGRADSTIRTLFDHAYEHVTDPAGRAMVCRAGAFGSALVGGAAAARRLYFEADELSRLAGDPVVRADVLAAAFTALGRPEDEALRREVALELHDIANDLGRDDLAYAAYRFDFSHAIAAGASDPRIPMAAIERTAERLGQPSRNWGLYAYRATIALLDGDTERAERYAHRLLGSDVTAGERLKTATFGAHLLAIRLVQGRVHELDSMVIELLAEQPEMRSWGAVRILSAANDDPAAARAAFDDLFDRDRNDLPDGVTMLPGLVVAGEGAVRLGNRARIEIMIHHLEPHGDRWAWFGAGSAGPIDLTLARLYAAIGDTDAARCCALRGLRSTRRVNAPAYAGDLTRVLTSL